MTSTGAAAQQASGAGFGTARALAGKTFVKGPRLTKATGTRALSLPNTAAKWAHAAWCIGAVTVFLGFLSAHASDPNCAPAWQGSTLVDAETLTGWAVERDTGSSGTLESVPGLTGDAVRLNWNIGSGDWVQARYTFPSPVDLSHADLFGLSLHGDTAVPANAMAIMWADTAGVFYGCDLPGNSHGINQVDRWLINLPLPKKLFRRFWGPGDQPINWSQINRLFVVVKRPGPGSGGGSGRLTMDHIQCDQAASWPRQTAFVTVDTSPARMSNAAAAAIGYLLSEQQPGGLLVSWKEESTPLAWLYDQALALIALARAGTWEGGLASNPAAQAADLLATFLMNAQKPDGHWARGWRADTQVELVDDGWVGDQGWCVMALAEYSLRSGVSEGLASAKRGAQWLASQIEPSGSIRGYGSTEGTVDVWWAMMATLRFPDAERIKGYLLSEQSVWDADLRYWWRGANDPMIAMDTATWVSVFARHPLVQQADRGLAALSFVRRTLVTTSESGLACGLDGQGPVSIWNEGTAQYVAAGGEDAAWFLETLLAQQNPDGSMPGSPDNFETDAFGWLTRWSGVAPTAWLHFAIRGLPFPEFDRDLDRDGMSDWSEFEAGTDPEDANSLLAVSDLTFNAVDQTVQLTWHSVSNRFYSVWRSSGLLAEWAPVPGYVDVPGTGQTMTFTSSTSGSTARFFRIECER